MLMWIDIFQYILKTLICISIVNFIQKKEGDGNLLEQEKSQAVENNQRSFKESTEKAKERVTVEC